MPQKSKIKLIKYCTYCGELLIQKQYKNTLESLFHFKKRKYCDRVCMGKAFDEKPTKSKDKSTTRYHSRKIMRFVTTCKICGKLNARDVHHIDGDYTNNKIENLARLCRSCHNKIHRKIKKCKICGNKYKGLGYCNKHYLRFKKYGDPLFTKYGIKK